MHMIIMINMHIIIMMICIIMILIICTSSLLLSKDRCYETNSAFAIGANL